jgi:hypothetical protein
LSVELTASSELVDQIGEEQFAEYLAMFDATIVGTQPDEINAWIVYTLDVPNAPDDAVQVIATYGTHQDGAKRTPFLYQLEWFDGVGRCVRTDKAF